jgi:hypothetical protein
VKIRTLKEKKQKKDNIKLARDINHQKEANPIKDDKYMKAYERFKRPAYQSSEVNANGKTNQETK